MCKGRVNDAVFGNTKHQLLDADTRQSISFSQQTVISGAVQTKYTTKVVVIVSDPNEPAFPSLTVF